MLRICIALALGTVLGAADLALQGTWSGAKAEIPAGSTVILAMYDRNGTCCGGPAAALAGLVNLRTSLQDKPGCTLIAVDVTAGATVEQAMTAAQTHQIADLPLLVDAGRATAAGLAVAIDMTMTYVIRKPDGSQVVAHSPAQVRRAL